MASPLPMALPALLALLLMLAPLAARHIAGFGAARDVAHEELLQVLQAPPQPGD